MTDHNKKTANRRKRSPLAGKLLFVSAAGAVLVSACSDVYAETSVGTTQHIGTGAVEIELREKSGGNDGGTASGIRYLLPGQSVVNGYEIVNKGYPCYIRAACTFSEFNDVLEIYGVPDEWIYDPSDGYYYCTEVLGNGSAVTFFEGFNVPADFSQDYENMTTELNVFAQAVQAANFNPDFGSGDPWGSIITEDADITEEYSVAGRFLGNGELKVTYLGGAEQLFVNRDDLFANLPVLIPGDAFEQTVLLENTGGRDINLYYYTECLKDDELLDSIGLSIRSDTGSGSRLIYQGSLAGKALEGRAAAALLGTIAPGGSGKLTFSLNVPEELTNVYSLNSSEVRWIFAAETVERNVTTVYSGKSPDTGDHNDIEIYFIVLGAAAVTAAAEILKKRRRSH